MALNHPLAAAALLALVAPAAAQQWRWEKVDSVGIQFQALNRLERIPMKLGPGNLYHRCRLRPKDPADYVRGDYTWYTDVYEFVKELEEEEEEETEEDEEKKKRINIFEFLRGFGKRFTTFKDWLDDDDENNVFTKGKPRKGTGGGLPYRLWEWVHPGSWGSTYYCVAAVYEFENREVALVVRMPVFDKKKKRPKGKYRVWVNRIYKSGKLIKPRAKATSASMSIAKREKWADTEYKKKCLEAAKKNIKNTKGWGYFTMPNYIVLYSWDFEKPAKRVIAYRQSKFYADRLEKMRKLYEEHYEMDETGTKAVMPDPNSLPKGKPKGPITPGRGKTDDEDEEDEEDEDEEGDEDEDEDDEKEKARKAIEEMRKRLEDQDEGEEKTITPPYPVFRLCATYAQFNKYGGTGGGVIGWFNPRSKELVVFLGGDRMMYKGATETVVYHEGWHQYSDLYFAGAQQHRWFDEGHGDFFGSFRWHGGKWRFVGSKMRYNSVKNMVRVGDYVPFKKITKWSRMRFYSGRGPYYYAQAYSMIDFLRRGKKLTKYWDPRYATILDNYRKALLLKRDNAKAVKIAFFQFQDADWEKLEKAWKAWVMSRHFKSGK